MLYSSISKKNSIAVDITDHKQQAKTEVMKNNTETWER